MGYSKLDRWEQKLLQALNNVDYRLEEHYQGEFHLKPLRPPKGRTSNPAYDGLFALQAEYSPGFGSLYGEGYVLSWRLYSVHKISSEQEEAIENQITQWLQEELDDIFGKGCLRIERDHHYYKIIGDLFLG